jgi:hypothetical protein
VSRARSRARHRRALLQDICTEFDQKREDPEAFATLLRRLAESNHRVWAIARLATRENPLHEEESAMVAQAVAPNLAGMTPGSVFRRHELAK